MSQPPAQLPMQRVFTISRPLFTIIEQFLDKTAGGFQPYDGGLFMVAVGGTLNKDYSAASPNFRFVCVQ